jgi:MFS family permease
VAAGIDQEAGSLGMDASTAFPKYCCPSYFCRTTNIQLRADEHHFVDPDLVGAFGARVLSDLQLITRHRGLATVSIVLGTFVSVLSSTIINVPIHDIARALHVSIANATLLITSSTIAFATLLPIGGWLGNRFGRKRVYCLAVAAIGIAGFVMLFAQNLGTMVAMRIVQGAGASAIVPIVMTMLSDMYEAERRALALSAWATANSLGQALGPPLGGVLVDAFGWRSTFVPVPALATLTLLLALRYVPPDPGRVFPLHWRGAVSLTAGALLLQIAFTMIPQFGAGSPVIWMLALAGLAFVVDFSRAIRRAAEPFVAPRAFREPSFMTSCISVFVATVCFGAVLLDTPLYLIQARGYPTSAAGFIAFALPLAMAILAPVTSRLVKRYGSTRTLRGSLAFLAVGSIAAAAIVSSWWNVYAFSFFLLLIGGGVAFAYTASAVGTTSTDAGRYGAGVGFFNLLRIAGSGVGAATVAIVLQHEGSGYARIFLISGGAVAAGLAATFFYRSRA